MYICICIYVYVYVYVHVDVCIHMYMYMYGYSYTYARTCARPYTHTITYCTYIDEIFNLRQTRLKRNPHHFGGSHTGSAGARRHHQRKALHPPRRRPRHPLRRTSPNEGVDQPWEVALENATMWYTHSKKKPSGILSWVLETLRAW